jgi:outer membrane protein, adhesin transport system
MKNKQLKNAVFTRCFGRHTFFGTLFFSNVAVILFFNPFSASLVFANTTYSIDELINRALSTYPTILSRQANKDAAEMDLNAAKLKFLPSPSLNTQRNEVAYAGQPYSNQSSTSISVNQPIWTGGSLSAGYNKADARLSAVDFALLETREDISRRIISTYSEWLKAWMKIKALEENVQLHEKFAGLITRRYEQGVASGVDRDLGISRLSQARAELETQKSIEQTTLMNLSEMIGETLSRNQLIGNLANHVNVPPRKDAILKALSNSATIQRFTFEAKASEAEAKEVKAQALPQISLQAQRQIGGAIIPGSPGYEFYGLVMTYSPGGGFSSIASASAAKERARAATIQIETAKRDLRDKLNAEFNDYEFGLVRRKSLQHSADLAAEISASYDRQYLVGRKSWLDLMNAVREHAQTKIQLADNDSALVGASRRLIIYIEGTSRFEN